MATTYRHNVQILSNFLRKQKIVAPSGPVRAAIPNLFEAIMLEQGDFASKGTGGFPFANRTIDTTLWYQKAASKPPLPEAPIFTFDNLMSTLGMLSFAIPDVGMFAYAGVGTLQQVVDNVTKQQDLQMKLSEVSNPPPDPFQHVIDDLKAKADTAQVENDINTLFGQIHAIQAVLNEYLLSPSQFVPSDLKAPRSGGPIKALKTRPGLTKEHVLDKQQGLGQIFTIEASDTWRKLAGANNEYRNQTIEAELQHNPSYAQATLTAFLHAAVTMLTAMQAYAFLYPLPPKAFEPGWDGKNPDGTPYDPIQAIRATKGQTPPANLPINGWDALNTVFDRVNPSGGLSFIPRLKEIDEIWRIIYARLSAVALQTGLPAHRNLFYWHLETDKSLNRQVSAIDMNNDTRWDIITQDVCENNQVAFVDWNLPTEKFIASYNHFQTHLNAHWEVGTGDSDLSKTLSTLEIAALGSYVLWLNNNFTDLDYPLVYPPVGPQIVLPALNEVFWTPASSNDASLNNARQPGFLSTQQGADVCAWLGLILSKYCEAYGFDIDLDKDINTLDFAHLIKSIFYGVYMATGQFLGVLARTQEVKAIPITFYNNSGRSVSLFSVDDEGHEKLRWTLPRDSLYSDYTNLGQVWHVRDAASGESGKSYIAVVSSALDTFLGLRVTVGEELVPIPIDNDRVAEFVPISIENNTGAAINIFVVNVQNQEESYGMCAPGGTFTHSALIGQIWVVRDTASGTVWKRIPHVGPSTVHVP